MAKAEEARVTAMTEAGVAITVNEKAVVMQ